MLSVRKKAMVWTYLHTAGNNLVSEGQRKPPREGSVTGELKASSNGQMKMEGCIPDGGL